MEFHVFDLLTSPDVEIWLALATFVIGVTVFLLAPIISHRQLHRVPAAQRPYADSLGQWAFRIMGLACIIGSAIGLLIEYRVVPPIVAFLVFLVLSVGWFFLRRRADLEQLASPEEEHA